MSSLDTSNWDDTLYTASKLDKEDPLSSYRELFYIPQKSDKECIYLCGNSLGLQLKTISKAISEELERWKNLGVEGWFESDRPWIKYSDALSKSMAQLVGAQSEEVVVMNTLTVNLHLLLASFYKPQGRKTRILMEKDAFPSDHHMVASQIKWHGLDPNSEIIYVHPDDNGLTSDQNIIDSILKYKDDLALVLLGGVNYLSGQFFDIQGITRTCKACGILIGFDLAHAAGNIPLHLHDWGVDFAAWCTYKYLNSGPGGPGTIFIHQNHHSRTDIKRLDGWWGHEEASRFLMDEEHIPSPGAAGWQISTPQIMNFVALNESLKVFSKVGMESIDSKRRKMNAYFDFLLNQLKEKGKGISVITPNDLSQRGAQFSIQIEKEARLVFDQLIEFGIIGDWRSPNIIRLSPAPLYNSYTDLYKVYKTFDQLL